MVADSEELAIQTHQAWVASVEIILLKVWLLMAPKGAVNDLAGRRVGSMWSSY